MSNESAWPRSAVSFASALVACALWGCSAGSSGSPMHGAGSTGDATSSTAGGAGGAGPTSSATGASSGTTTTASSATTGVTSTGASGGASTSTGAGGAPGGTTTSGSGGAPGMDASVGPGDAGGAPGTCRPAMGTSPKMPIRPQSTFHAAVNKFFSSADPFVQSTVLPNIDKNRKSDATLKLVTPDGRPAAGYQISAVLVDPDFHWGACPPRPTNGSESSPGPTEEKLWGEIFNYAIPQYTTKWANIETVQGTFDFAAADKLLDIFDRDGVRMEQHFLTGYHPDWLAALPDAGKGALQEKFALAILDRYHDRIKYWQVYNEEFKTHIALAVLYVDEKSFFQKITTMYPNLYFGVNDHWEFEEPGGLPPPAEVKTRYPGIHFLGVHAHSPRRLWASPQQIYQTFDPYTNSGIFIHITEFGIISDENGDSSLQGGVKTGNWTDDLLAEYFVQTLATNFSHPAVESFNHFGVGPDVNRYTGNNLFRDGDGGALTPAYYAIRSLLVDKFRTLAEGTADAAGQLKYRGFQGEYEVTVTSPAGAASTGRIYLKPGAAQEFTLEVAPGTLQICGP